MRQSPHIEGAARPAGRPAGRWRNPATLAFALAMLASLSVHLPIYSALGVLADWVRTRPQPAAPSPVEIEFSVGDTSGVPASLAMPPAARPTPAPPRRVQRRRQADKSPTLKPPKRAPSPKPKVQKPPAPPRIAKAPPKPKVQKPPALANKQAIRQRSRNPEVEPPPNARYIAEQNQRVERETVARLRNYQQDDPEPALGHRPSEPHAHQAPGDSAESRVADRQDRPGPDDRAPRSSARPDKAVAPPSRHTHTPPRTAATAPQPAPGAAGAPGRTGARGAPGQDARRPGLEPGVVVANDGMGRFVVRRGQGGQAGGGGRRPVAGRRGQGGQGGRGVDLRLSWNQFARAMGEGRLAEERKRYRERRSGRRGFNHRARWREFRAAIENFTPNVQPGNQTALNAAANPFANYLTAVHLRIHREFADRFLRSIPAVGNDPFADRSLMTKLEIIINADGSVHKVGVVKSSGFLLFDHGAYTSVMRAAPFPAPPGSIKSGDGRVYFHWGFYRNERQCGTFNAEPYILPNPPGSPRDRG